jgi:hypothetical protein
MGVQEGGREMTSEERRAATREMRRRLEEIRKQVDGQRERLLEAHARLDPRASLNITPEMRERFEQLCVVPARPAGTGGATPQIWSAVRC